MVVPIVQVEVQDQELLRMMAAMPKVFGAELNRTYKGIGGEFNRIFTRARLNKRGITPRRKSSKGAKGRGTARENVFVSKKMRLLGFRASVENFNRLQGKALYIRSGSKVTIRHEVGGPPIRPKTKPYLVIPVKSVRGLRRAGVKVPRGAKPRFIRVKQVNPRKRLGFIRTWNRYQNQAFRRIDRGVDRAIRRADQISRRASLRRVGRAVVGSGRGFSGQIFERQRIR